MSRLIFSDDEIDVYAGVSDSEIEELILSVVRDRGVSVRRICSALKKHNVSEERVRRALRSLYAEKKITVVKKGRRVYYRASI